MPTHTQKDDELEEIRDFLSSSVNIAGDITDVSRRFGRATITWRFESPRGEHFYLKRHEARSLSNSTSLSSFLVLSTTFQLCTTWPD